MKKKVVGNLGQYSIKKDAYTCSYFYNMPGLKILIIHYQWHTTTVIMQNTAVL